MLHCFQIVFRLSAGWFDIMTSLCGCVRLHCSTLWIWLTELYSRLVRNIPVALRNKTPGGRAGSGAEDHAQPTEGNVSASCTVVSMRFKRSAPLGLVFGEVDATLCWETEHDSPTTQPGASCNSRQNATVVSLVRHGSEADELGVRPGMVLFSVGDHLVETGYGGSGSTAESCVDGSSEIQSAPAVGFDDALGLIRRAGRPVTLRFIAAGR